MPGKGRKREGGLVSKKFTYNSITLNAGKKIDFFFTDADSFCTDATTIKKKHTQSSTMLDVTFNVVFAKMSGQHPATPC